MNLIAMLTPRLLGHAHPVAGIVDHGTGVEETVAEPVADVTADAIRRPVEAAQVTLLRCEHHNVLHIAPAEARTAKER